MAKRTVITSFFPKRSTDSSESPAEELDESSVRSDNVRASFTQMEYGLRYSGFCYSRSDEECTADSTADQSGTGNGSTCSASCCRDATYAPVHVTDSYVLLKTKKLQGKKWHSEWFKMYPWLVLCTTRFQAFCSYCRYSNKLPYQKKRKRSFVQHRI